MPRFFYQYPDNRWNNYGNYPEMPQWTPEGGDGGQWVEGTPTGPIWQPDQPFEERLADKFQQLLNGYKDQLSVSTIKEVMQLEAVGSRYLRFGLMDVWQSEIEAYVPSNSGDEVMVNQLKPMLLAEFD